MNVASSTSLLSNAFGSLGSGVYSVLGYFIALALALMVFYFGWRFLRLSAVDKYKIEQYKREKSLGLYD